MAAVGVLSLRSEAKTGVPFKSVGASVKELRLDPRADVAPSESSSSSSSDRSSVLLDDSDCS